jgi:hypothetical protein
MDRRRLQEIKDEVARTWPVGTADADLLPALLLRELIAALEEANSAQWTADAMAKHSFGVFGRHFGLTAEDLGRTVTIQRRTFVITGWNARARRMPIEATETSSGRRFRLTPESVRNALGRHAR